MAIPISERPSNRLAELERKFGSTITKYNSREIENINRKRASAPPPIHRVAARQKLRRLSPRELARRETASMGKTVEISDGTGDFDRLMAAEFGEVYDERVWKLAKDLFSDSTGLRLIGETDD